MFLEIISVGKKKPEEKKLIRICIECTIIFFKLIRVIPCFELRAASNWGVLEIQKISLPLVNILSSDIFMYEESRFAYVYRNPKLPSY